MGEVLRKEWLDIAPLFKISRLMGMKGYCPSDDLNACHCVQWSVLGGRDEVIAMIEEELNIVLDIKFVN